MPKLSVIIPTYNRANLVIRSVKSVQMQSVADTELIIVDDGSTDNTANVIKIIKDSRIKYLYKKNGGASSARNLGLKKAQGEYIAFLDSDDLWPENFSTVMLSSLEKNKDYGAAYSVFKEKLLNGTEKDAFGSDRHFSGWLTKLYYEKTPTVSPTATVFRSAVWKDFWWDEALETFNDVDAFLRISVRTRFLFVPNTFAIRVHTPDSLVYKPFRNFSCNPVHVFERFYYHFGGEKYVPSLTAKKKISREYRGLARQHYRAGNRKAAVDLLKKAIAYFPYDYHYYKELIKAFLLSKKNDKIPDWQMPKPLPPYITVNNKVIKCCNRQR